MVRPEVFYITHDARAPRRWRVVGRRMTRRFGFGAGIGGPYCLDAHRDRAEVEVEVSVNARVQSRSYMFCI